MVTSVHLAELTSQDRARPAAIAGGTGAVTSYGDLDDESKRLAQCWASHGLRPGDAVAVLMTNDVRFLTVTWAAWRSGFYVVPVNWHLTAAEAQYIVTNSGARALVTSAELAGLGSFITAATDGALEVALLVDGRGGGRADHDGFDDYHETVAACPSEPLAEERNGALMLYSSGTTGQPKGIRVPLSGAPFGTPLAMEALVSSVAGIDSRSVYLCPAPLYHAAPLGWSLGVQAIGGCVVVMDRFDPESTLALIERHRVTHAQFVPTMFVRMLGLPDEVRRRYDLSSLRYVVHAAAPCPLAVKERMIEWLGPIVHEYYGASEGNCFFTIDAPTWLEHRGSVGRALLGTAHILDEDGVEVPAGETGQIWIESPVRFAYQDDADKTAAAYNERGWSTIGDLGWLDDDGFLYLADRRTDLILVGGANVYPREVEDVLLGHPAVADVAVIGVPDDDMGQRVTAIVEPAPDVDADDVLADELIEFCRDRLARFKCPRSVAFDASLPRLPTGKLLRRALRDRYAEPQTGALR